MPSTQRELEALLRSQILPKEDNRVIPKFVTAAAHVAAAVNCSVVSPQLARSTGSKARRDSSLSSCEEVLRKYVEGDDFGDKTEQPELESAREVNMVLMQRVIMSKLEREHSQEARLARSLSPELESAREVNMVNISRDMVLMERAAQEAKLAFKDMSLEMEEAATAATEQTRLAVEAGQRAELALKHLSLEKAELQTQLSVHKAAREAAEQNAADANARAPAADAKLREQAKTLLTPLDLLGLVPGPLIESAATTPRPSAIKLHGHVARKSDDTVAWGYSGYGTRQHEARRNTMALQHALYYIKDKPWREMTRVFRGWRAGIGFK